MRYFVFAIVFGLTACAAVDDYTPSIAPSARLDTKYTFVDGLPARDDSELSSSELDDLDRVRRMNTFSIVFKSKGNTKLTVNNQERNFSIIDGYSVYNVPRDICVSSIKYKIEAHTQFDSDFAYAERPVSSGIFVEKYDVLVENVYRGANNRRGLHLYRGEGRTAKVRNYIHVRDDVAKLAIRSTRDNPDLIVQVKLPSESEWTTISDNWIEFPLQCGEYFEITAHGRMIDAGITLTESVNVNIVDQTGRYDWGHVFDVVLNANPG